MIPTVLHHVWVSDDIPQDIQDLIDTFPQHLPSGWEFKLWRMDDVKSLPTFGYTAEWMPRAFMCDLVRIEILHRYGGFYVDADCRCVNDWSGWHRNPHGIVLCREHRGKSIFNGFMGSVAGHNQTAIMFRRMKRVADTAVAKFDDGGPFNAWLPKFSGPWALRQALCDAGSTVKFPIGIKYGGGPPPHPVHDGRIVGVLHEGHHGWHQQQIDLGTL